VSCPPKPQPPILLFTPFPQACHNPQLVAILINPTPVINPMPHEIKFRNEGNIVIVSFDGKEVTMHPELADIIYSSLKWAIVEDTVKIVDGDGSRVYLTLDDKVIIKRQGDEIIITFDTLTDEDRKLIQSEAE
jgi:hypothetical protein